MRGDSVWKGGFKFKIILINRNSGVQIAQVSIYIQIWDRELLRVIDCISDLLGKVIKELLVCFSVGRNVVVRLYKIGLWILELMR